MIYKIEPVEVPHESILALKLHQQTLVQDYESLIKSTCGTNTDEYTEIKMALKSVKQKMLDCQKIEAWVLERLRIEGILTSEQIDKYEKD